MFQTYHFSSVILRLTVMRKDSTRFISFFRVKNAFQNLFGRNSKLPYHHICQIGDPILRGRAMTIEPEVIKMADFQKIIKHLINVMRSYGANGLAGPQIGLPWQIFVIEFTEKHMEKINETVRKAQEIEIIPIQVFINPQLKVTDYTPIALDEVCESVRGFSAVVSRPYAIEITALNSSAEQFTRKAQGWPSRLIQHEYDHLQGKLYTDKMDISTFNCTAWDKINTNNGKIRLEYWPKY